MLSILFNVVIIYLLCFRRNIQIFYVGIHVFVMLREKKGGGRRKKERKLRIWTLVCKMSTFLLVPHIRITIPPSNTYLVFFPNFLFSFPLCSSWFYLCLPLFIYLLHSVLFCSFFLSLFLLSYLWRKCIWCWGLRDGLRHSSHQVHLRTNPLWKGMNPLIPSAMG